jgi:hypothetical protein
MQSLIDKIQDYAGALGIFLVVLGFFILLIGGSAIWNHWLYSGKSVHCIEDTGAEFNSIISKNIVDTFLYFQYAESGLRFKAEDGRLYQCRGIAEME